MRDDPYYYELYLLASAALLLLTLLVWGIFSLTKGVIRLIRKRSETASLVKKKHVRLWKVFLVIIAAELIVIAGAGGVMTVIHARSFDDRPALNTESRVVNLGKYKGITFTKTGIEETDGRTALYQAAQGSEFYLNTCDVSYLYQTEEKRITDAAKALGTDVETYFNTVVRPQIRIAGVFYNDFNQYILSMPDDALKMRLVAKAIAAKEHIAVTEADIAAAGEKLGYAAADLTAGSSALEEATAEALKSKGRRVSAGKKQIIHPQNYP